MKIHDTISEVSIEQIKEAISFKEVKELVEHFDYEDDFRFDMLELLNLDKSDYLGMIPDSYMNKYIKDNLGYYDVTNEMKNKILRLEMQIEKSEKSEIKLPAYTHKVKEFFCDLLDLGYHTSNRDIINRITNLI